MDSTANNPPENVIFNTMFKATLYEFKEYMIRESLSKNTIGDYLAISREFLQYTQIYVERLDPIHIIQYKEKISINDNLKASSVNKKLLAVKKFLTWLFESKRISTEISKSVKLISIQKSILPPKALTEREVNLLYQFASRAKSPFRQRDYSILKFMLNTGLRVSEVSNLNRGDLTINERSGQIRVSHGKGNKERIVILNQKARSAINDYYEYLEKNGHTWTSDLCPVFLPERGERMSIAAIQKMIGRISDRSKVTIIKVSPHILRHTFATNFYKASKNLVGLGSLLGHSSLNTTSIYTVQSEEELLKSLDKI